MNEKKELLEKIIYIIKKEYCNKENYCNYEAENCYEYCRAKLIIEKIKKIFSGGN